MMVYVQRDRGTSAVKGLFCRAQPQPDGSILTEPDPLPDDHPDVIAYLAPKPPLDQADIDNLDKAFKAISLLTRQYANALKAGTFVAKSIADVRSDFMAIYRALP